MKQLFVFVLVAAPLLSHAELPGNGKGRAEPPAAASGKGPVKSATLIKQGNRNQEAVQPSNPLKGPDWIEMDSLKDGDASAMHVQDSPNRKFTLKLTESPENEGDIAVYKVTLTFNDQGGREVDLGLSAGAVISPDSRYIVLERLQLLDIGSWKIYNLQKALQLQEGYSSVERWSRDGKKFLVQVTQCPYDCPPTESVEYWLIQLE